MDAITDEFSWDYSIVGIFRDASPLIVTYTALYKEKEYEDTKEYSTGKK